MMYNMKQFQKATGMKESYIRRCVKELRPILAKHITRGANNSLMFDSSAVVIFQRIKELKKEGYSLDAIRKEYQDQPSNEPPPTALLLWEVLFS